MKKHSLTEKSPDPQSALCLRMMQLCAEIIAAGDACLAKTGLTHTRFTILYHLAQSPSGLNPKALATRLVVPKATMTGLLDALEKEGHIARHPDPSDRRALLARLTESGLEFVHNAVPVHCDRLSRMMATLSESERKTLAAMLDKLEQAVKTLEDPQ